MPNIEDKKRILTALGYSVEAHDWFDYVDHGHIPRVGFKLIYQDKIIEKFPLESAAWNSVEIDANFCFANIVPFVNAEEFIVIRTETVAKQKLEATYSADFAWYEGDSDFGPTRVSNSGVGPTVEAAIQEAFISYLKEQQV